MNFQEQPNIISGDYFLQTFFLINNLYNQQIFQYMNSLVECVPNAEYREDNTKLWGDQNTDRKIQKSYQVIKNQPVARKNLDLLNKEHTRSDDEDNSSRANGHWSKQEHQLYLQFVKDHEDILRSKYDKKSKKIFKLMSQCILTRTATQCRSHHQKFNPLQKSKRKARNLVQAIPCVITQEN